MLPVNKFCRSVSNSSGLTKRTWEHMLDCVKKHDDLVADSQKLQAVLPELTKAQLKVSVLEKALERLR